MVKVHSPAPVRSNQDPAYPFNGNRHIRISDAAKFLGVSEAQVRLLADNGSIAGHKTLGNHRRLDARSVYAWATGLTPEEASDSPAQRKQGLLIGMVRVSSRGQAKAKGNSEQSSLEHQQDRVSEFSRKKYGRDVDEWNIRTASGMNFEHPSLLFLVRRITSGELRGATIIATTFDRVCRFGIKLIQHLCATGGVELVFCCADEDQTEQEELVSECLAVITHYTAKVSGNKARKILKVVMDEKSLIIAYKMKRKGASYEAIARRFDDEGRTDEKGRRYSPNIIRKNLLENADMLAKLLP